MKLLNSGQLMDRINFSLDKQEPLSVISVGQTEAFVMAQYTIFPEHEFMVHGEAYRANQGAKSGFNHRGIRFPNIKARDEAVEATKKASIVGYNTIEPWSKELTEKVFQVYNIKPKYVFEANLRRAIMFSQRKKFEQMLSGRKILLISSLAPETKTALDQKVKKKLGFEVVGAIPIYEYEEIPDVKRQIDQYEFDLCLLAAGINAVILAPYIAEKYGKVAVDLGSGMRSLITGEMVTDAWITGIIGIDNLLNM